MAIRDSEFGRLLGEKPFRPVLFGAAALIAGLALGESLHWFLASPSEQSGTVTPQVLRKPPAAIPGATAPLAAAAISEPAITPATVPTVGPGAIAVTPISSLGTIASVPEVSRAKPHPITEAENGTRLSADAAKRFAGYRLGTNNLLKARIEATRERLEREPDGSYSIELFATDNGDPARIERFLIRARELVPLDNVYVLPQASSGRYRIRVTYGGYPDRISALQAAESLPPKYRQAFRPELRTFAELRDAL